MVNVIQSEIVCCLYITRETRKNFFRIISCFFLKKEGKTCCIFYPLILQNNKKLDQKSFFLFPSRSPGHISFFARQRRKYELYTFPLFVRFTANSVQIHLNTQYMNSVFRNARSLRCPGASQARRRRTPPQPSRVLRGGPGSGSAAARVQQKM